MNTILPFSLSYRRTGALLESKTLKIQRLLLLPKMVGSNRR
jgi:hypothetical protein